MKILLATIICCQIFFLGLLGGYTYLLYRQVKKSDQCIDRIFKRSVALEEFYGHRIDAQTLWSHAQGLVANQYLQCMGERDNENL